MKVPATPDPTLPLLDNRRFACFARLVDGKHIAGRVFAQRREPGSTKVHPSHFYVEFPEGDFHAVSATRLCAILADNTAKARFDLDHLAYYLGRIQTTIPFPKLLAASAP